MTPPLDIHPLTAKRWRDLETLFGERGACGGCWCMWFRLPRPQFEKQKGAGNKQSLKKLVESGPPPGLLAYVKGQPVAWCALAPREAYPRLERSRVSKRIDDKPVWSIVCLFVAKPFRRKGITSALLAAAAEYAWKRGAAIVEGYPVDPKTGPTADVFAYTGVASAFRKAGFEEVMRRSATRPIMRRVL